MKSISTFWLHYGELLVIYNEIWHKVSNTVIRFDSKPVYNEKCLRNKVKSYPGKISTLDMWDISDSQCFCLSVILINSVFRIGKNCHLQRVLEECKYVVKEKKMPKYITDIVEISSDQENSEEENSGEENFDEENYNEE